MAMMFSPFLLLLFLVGGENTLSGYLDAEAFWLEQGIEMNAASLRQVLDSEDGAVDDDKVAALISQLGGKTHEQRQGAMDALAGMGVFIRPQLEKAAKMEDPEISTRAKTLLEGLTNAADEEGLTRLMAIQGLADLEDKDSLKLLRRIAKGDNPIEARAADRAVRHLTGQAPSVRELEPRGQLVSRFPDVTFCLGQLHLLKRESELIPRVQKLSTVNTFVKEMLMAVGDMEVHRVTGAMNQEVFQDDDLLVGLLFLEMDYESLSFAKWLMQKYNFQASKRKDMIYLHRNHMVVWPLSNEHLVFAVHGENHPGDQVLDVVEGFRAPDESRAHAESLTNAIKRVPEKADLWAALYFPEQAELPREIEDALIYGSLSVYGTVKKDSVSLTLQGVGTDAEQVKEQVLKRKAERDELVAELQNNPMGGTPPMSTLLKTAKEMTVDVDKETVTLNASLPLSLLGEILNELERFDQRMNQRQQRMMQRQQRMRMQQQAFGAEAIDF